MDDARPRPIAPDPTLLPAELRRPLAEGAIVAGRPAAVAWATWGFGLTWILGLAAWSPWFAGVGGLIRMLGDALSVLLFVVVVVLMVGVQFGLLRGRLLAWAAAVNLSALTLGLLAHWLHSLGRIGIGLIELFTLFRAEAASALAALSTLMLLLHPASRRWFWRASALRSRARSLATVFPPGRPS
jgi:hypothetical protein